MVRVNLLLDSTTAAFITERIRNYYRTAGRIPISDVARREFGFGDFEKKIAFRHFAFNDDRDLKEYLVRNAPPFVSSSSSLYEKPAARPMEAKGFTGSELVFDLDADDLHLPCKNVHGGAWVCKNCFDSVKNETIKLIEDFLVPDFGFSLDEITINFSGNRGYHVHVHSKEVMKLDSKARKSISNYIAGIGIELDSFFPALGMRGMRLEGPKPTDPGWGGKLANGMVKALNTGVGALMELGISKKDANLLMRKHVEVILGITTGNWDKVRIPKKAEFWKNVLHGMAISQSDAIDKNVTNDIYHLIRVPGTIHSGSGLVGRVISSVAELEKFKPLDDAIAFKGGEVHVKTSRVPKFEMMGTSFGPYENTGKTLPTCVGAYLMLKRLAVLG